MVVVWNEKGAALSPYRTVLEQLAPKTLAVVEVRLPGQGNYIRADSDQELLDLVRA
jgi:hypothetical protein